jgi:hypothetical protein
MNLTDSIMNATVKNMLVSVVDTTKQTGARFASLTYTNENGATTRYNIMFGISMLSLYKSDLRTITALRPSLTGIKAVAADEIIASINNSLTKGIGNNDAYTLKGYYTPITPNGEVKLHKDEKTGETFLYLRGYVVKSTVLVPGVYPKVNSSEKTLAKKELEKNMKRSKIRTFKINVTDLHEVKTNGMTVEIS